MGVTEASNCREAQFCVSSAGRALAWTAMVLSAPCDGDPARPVRGAHSPLPSTAVRIAAAAAAHHGPAAPLLLARAADRAGPCSLALGVQGRSGLRSQLSGLAQGDAGPGGPPATLELPLCAATSV